jgi:hypothetical protein
VPTDLEARERRGLRLGVAGMLDAAGARPPWLLLGLAGAMLLAALALLGLALGLCRADRATVPAGADRAAGAAGPGGEDEAEAPGVPQPTPAAPRVSSRA